MNLVFWSIALSFAREFRNIPAAAKFAPNLRRSCRTLRFVSGADNCNISWERRLTSNATEKYSSGTQSGAKKPEIARKKTHIVRSALTKSRERLGAYIAASLARMWHQSIGIRRVAIPILIHKAGSSTAMRRNQQDTHGFWNAPLYTDNTGIISQIVIFPHRVNPSNSPGGKEKVGKYPFSRG